MSARAKELALRWPAGLGLALASGLAPSALAIVRPTALGTSTRGNPGEARLLSTARVSSATSTAPALVRTSRFTAPSTPRGPCARSRTALLPPRPPPPPPLGHPQPLDRGGPAPPLLQGPDLGGGDHLAGRPPG